MIIDSNFFKILEEEMKVPFDWNKNNCAQFVGRVYARIYDKDFLSGFEGDYHDKLSAFEFVKNKGGWNSILTGLGFEEVPRHKIGRGDIVVAENALGIFDGAHAVFAGGGNRPMSKITNIYKYKEN